MGTPRTGRTSHAPESDCRISHLACILLCMCARALHVHAGLDAQRLAPGCLCTKRTTDRAAIAALRKLMLSQMCALFLGRRRAHAAVIPACSCPQALQPCCSISLAYAWCPWWSIASTRIVDGAGAERWHPEGRRPAVAPPLACFLNCVAAAHQPDQGTLTL